MTEGPLARFFRSDGPAMAAETTDVPEERAAGAVVLFEASQAKTARAVRPSLEARAESAGVSGRSPCERQHLGGARAHLSGFGNGLLTRQSNGVRGPSR